MSLMGQKSRCGQGIGGWALYFLMAVYTGCLHFLGLWFPSQTQRQPQKHSALPLSICVLLIQCSGLGQATYFPGGTCFSIVCWFRVSSCWPSLHLSSMVFGCRSRACISCPVKHAFKSSQWHWEQRLAQLGFRRAWIPCHLSHSWENSALKCSTCSNQSVLLAVKALSPEHGHSCTSSCHLPFAGMPSSTFKGPCDYTEPTQILRRDNLTPLR